MKTPRTPAVVLVLLYLCFFGYLVISIPQLPARVASHFDGGGRPDGWMSRSSCVLFTAGLGVGFPSLIVCLFYLMRFFPGGLNIPHREYWLAPGRRAETFGYLLRQSLWFACMALAFVTGLHFLVVQANRQVGPQLPTGMIVGLGACYLAGVVAWVVNLVRHFGRPLPGPDPQD
jgi:uncharacterized membrane protein